MAFTAAELASIANAALDYYFKQGDDFKQAVQRKPLIQKFESKAKTFPGGKGDISIGVKGAYGDGSGNDVLKGYTHDDQVNFYTPANIERANFPWRETHIGLTMTHTELKIDGLSVTETNGSGTRRHSNREMHALHNLLEDKLEDMSELYLRGLDDMFHGDGTADALGFTGIAAYVAANPTVGTVGGINAATNTWWRNRASTAAHAAAGGQGAITVNPANGGALAEHLQKEWRQLIRYGGKPDYVIAGSDFIAGLEKEMRANGYYSDNGFTGGGDMSVGEMRFKGLTINYDPWLDDNGLSKRSYWLDCKAIMLMKMQGEWRRSHTPARPADQFVLYRSLTSTGQIVCNRRNSSAVIDIA